MKKCLVLFACLMTVLKPVYAVDPSLEWNTLSTEHFRIHFSDGAEDTARRIAGIAENTHARLGQWLSWQPAEPTHVVVSDESDFSNGFAGPIPYNRTTLFLTPPRGITSLEDYHDWLTLLFVHEYTHILHLDKASGAPDNVRQVLGRFFLLAFPNAIQPLWFVEGLAVHQESDHGIGTGRAQSSYFRMLMRRELETGLKPVEQVNQAIRSWPAGFTPYLYGGYFLRFLEAEYGEKVIHQWVAHYSDNLIPARLNSTARLATGKSVPELWNEFGEWLQRHFSEEETITAEFELAEGERLTEHGFQTGSIDAGPENENSFYYVRQDHLRHAALMRWESPVVTQKLAALNSGAVIDVRADDDVLIAQPEVCDNYAIYFDLFRYTYEHGLQRLTHCARYVRARWKPDSEQIAAVHVENGQSALHLVNSAGEQIEVLWQGSNDEVLGDVDWSPDGSRIAAAVWRPKLGWNIEEYTVADRRWAAITDSPVIEASPRYSNNGDTIVFSAEYGGVYNIWQYTRDTKQFAMLTNVGTGAFQPVVASESVYYLGSHDQGYDVYQLKYPREIITLDYAPSEEPMPAPATERAQQGEVEPYSAVSTLRPRWWFPHIIISDEANEVGIITGGNDAINRHSYAATLAVDVDNDYPVGGVAYRYNPLNWVSFQLGAASTNDVMNDANGNFARVRRNDTLQATAFFPFSGLARSWGVLAGVATDHESEQRTVTGLPPIRSFRDNIAGVGLIYSDSARLPRSISEAAGRTVRVAAENSDVFDSDFSGNLYVLDWREFIRLNESEHVIGLRYLRGHGTDRPRLFELGGIQSESVLGLLGGESAEPLLNRREYEFRGYKSGIPGLLGRRMQLVSGEWRFPIRLVERGLMAPAVGLSRISGRAFVENAAAWQGSGPDKTFTSAGFELHLDVNALYFSDFRLRAGFAHGFDDRFGQDEFYLSIRGGF